MESGNIKLQKFTPISYGDLLPRKIKGEEERKGMRGVGKKEREKGGGSNTDGLNFLNTLGNCVLFFLSLSY